MGHAGLVLPDAAGRLYLASAPDKAVPWARKAAIGSIAALALAASHAATGWLLRIVPPLRGNDPTIELFGWDQLPAQLAAAGLLREGGFLIADGWQNAGRMDIAFGGARAVLPATADPRHFAFILDPASLKGRAGVAVVRARREQQMRQTLAPFASALGPSAPVALGRAGVRELDLVAFPVEGFTGRLPWPYGRGRTP